MAWGAAASPSGMWQESNDSLRLGLPAYTYRGLETGASGLGQAGGIRLGTLEDARVLTSEPYVSFLLRCMKTKA